jgi:dihydroorotate dehydrogenase
MSLSTAGQRNRMNSNRRSSYRNENRDEPRKVSNNEEKEEDNEVFKEMTKKMNTVVTELKRLAKNQKKMAKTKIINWIKIVPEETEQENEQNTNDILKETDAHKRMIVDTGCPNSIAGKRWLTEYLKYINVRKEDLKHEECSERFKFGPSEEYEAKEKIEIPISVKISEEKDTFKNEKI